MNYTLQHCLGVNELMQARAAGMLAPSRQSQSQAAALFGFPVEGASTSALA